MKHILRFCVTIAALACLQTRAGSLPVLAVPKTPFARACGHALAILALERLELEDCLLRLPPADLDRLFTAFRTSCEHALAAEPEPETIGPRELRPVFADAYADFCPLKAR